MSKYWTTKGGKKTLISEMETFHIVNCMKYIERNDFEFEEGVYIEGTETTFSYQFYVPVCLKSQYNHMKKELKKRGFNYAKS